MSNQGARRNGPVKLRLTGEERLEGYLLPPTDVMGKPEGKGGVLRKTRRKGEGVLGVGPCFLCSLGNCVGFFKRDGEERRAKAPIYVSLLLRGEHACCDIM